ncbi:MAG: biosynthetic arginine decarboxylase [Pseudomonadota bacterium]
MCSQKSWDATSAKRHFRVAQWGMGHFDINAQGNVVAKTSELQIDLYNLSKQLRSNGVQLPVLVRFPQILQQSLENLSSAFKAAMSTHHYTGQYIAAYPIKVNQQASVIKHFQSQTQWPIAFEVGSKAELIACLGIIDTPRTIICNGYKDEDYIRLALIGILLGHDVVIVLESKAEFKYVLEQSEVLNVQPRLGMRVRLSSIAKGNWQNTGGEYSKFGFTANEILELIGVIKEKKVQHWMKMLHFHMGSQISNLQDIRIGVQEGIHYFSQLYEHGIDIEMLNIGGGLAVDYEGSKNENYFSMNYSIQDYANVIIKVVYESCAKHALKMPTIFSENGRAMTAYHAVLISNVIDSEFVTKVESKISELIDAKEHSKYIVKLHELANEIDGIVKNSLNLLTTYNKLKSLLEKIQQAFSQSEISLKEKAIAEKLTHHIYHKIITTTNDLPEDDLAKLKSKLVAKYFCNFSLFQSTPDIWGLQQILPIVPLHRLDERPTIPSRIYDLTCDSDGRVDQYIEDDSIQGHLSLHEFQHQEDYVIGFFLVGAYQEILGDMHNLFGDTNAVNIMMNVDGSYQICDEEPGDTTAEILSYLHIDTNSMRQHWLDRLARNDVSEQMKERVMDELESSLAANSYLG